MFETSSWKKYKYHHVSQRIEPDHDTPGWPPNFYLSDRGFFGKCWSVDIPYMPRKQIHSFGIVLLSDIFPNGIRPARDGFGIVIHYPGQLLKADIGTYEWKSQAEDPPFQFTMRINIEDMMVLKRRNKINSACNEQWKLDDNIIYDRILNRVHCVPPYWKMMDNVTQSTKCTSENELAMIYEEALRIKTSKVHLPPCTEIEKLIYNYDEFNWLVDDWAVNDTNKEQRAFEILIEFNDGTYTEISQVKAYNAQKLVGNIGGFLGLFMGYR